MSRWRIGLVVVLFMAPFVFLIGVGSWHLVDARGPLGFRLGLWYAGLFVAGGLLLVLTPE